MNEKGNLLILIAIGFLLLMIIPIAITKIFPIAGIIARILLIFTLYTLVRGFLGSGPVTLVVSAILIYFMAFKWFDLVLGLWIFQILLGLSFTSVVIWGIGMNMRRH